NPHVSMQAVEDLISRHQEPEWLARERRAAFETYLKTAWPTNRDEAWRYTELDRFSIEGLELTGEPRSQEVPARIDMRVTDSDAEGVLVHKGTSVVKHDASIREAGVIFTDLRTALREHGDLVKEHLYAVVN